MRGVVWISSNILASGAEHARAEQRDGTTYAHSAHLHEEGDGDTLRIHHAHAVLRRPQRIARPALQPATDVDDERARRERHVAPAAALVDLEAALAALVEDRQDAHVAVALACEALAV